MASHALSRLLRTRNLLREYRHSYRANALTYSQLKQTKQFSTTNQLKNKDDEDGGSAGNIHNLPITLNPKYKTFRDEDSEVIFDTTEEGRRIKLEDLNILTEQTNIYEGLNLERGVRGVYDIEDLISVLKKDNARQIFVASVPQEYSYVDYVVIVTGKSQRHMHALANFVRRVYKMKRHTGDILPRIEGENSKDWIAMDLGNLVLHIFSNSARSQYDLETLWSVGSEYDDLSNKPVEANIMDQYNAFLAGLEPASTGDEMKN